MTRWTPAARGDLDARAAVSGDRLHHKSMLLHYSQKSPQKPLQPIKSMLSPSHYGNSQKRRLACLCGLALTRCALLLAVHAPRSTFFQPVEDLRLLGEKRGTFGGWRSDYRCIGVPLARLYRSLRVARKCPRHDRGMAGRSCGKRGEQATAAPGVDRQSRVGSPYSAFRDPPHLP